MTGGLSLASPSLVGLVEWTKTVADVGVCESVPDATVVWPAVTALKSEWPSRDHRSRDFASAVPIDRAHGCVALTLSDKPFAEGVPETLRALGET